MATDDENKEMIHTKIWYEEPSADNPFTAEKCFCSGYDVYSDLLPNASYFEYLYLLFMLERPEKWQAEMLEKIAIAIANPGIRHHSIRAAMCAGVGGSTSASALMAALSVGAGQLNGAREVYLMVEWWQACRLEPSYWKQIIEQPPTERRASVWPECEHTPGFDPHGASCTKPVIQTLALLADIKPNGALGWLIENRQQLESYSKSPLSMSGVIATAFYDLGFTSEQAEMMYLFMRLPGAAVHALEQKNMGWKKYPFFGPDLKITNDSGE